MFLYSTVTVQQRCCNVPTVVHGQTSRVKTSLSFNWDHTIQYGHLLDLCVLMWPDRQPCAAWGSGLARERAGRSTAVSRAVHGEGQVSRVSRAETPVVKKVVVRIQYKLYICLPRMKLDRKETFASILIDDSNLLLCRLSPNRTFVNLHWYTWEEQQSFGH